MRHFSIEQWADFALQVIGEDEKTAMQAHLETGCKPCTKVLHLWTRVRQAADRESTYQPPESAVRSVKGMGAIHVRPTKAPLVRLLFDSANSPLAAGVRSVSTVARQVLYGVGAYRIDLRMEPEMDSDKVSLVGQILNSAEPAKHPSGVDVFLSKGRKVLAKSQTNGFGEFHLKCDLESRLELRIILPKGTEVRIPLVEPAKGPLPHASDSTESPKVRGQSGSTRKKV